LLTGGESGLRLKSQIQGELKPNPPSLFEELGGEARLRAIIEAFIDRVFEDRMIGFFSRNADRGRIKEFEYQHAAAFLGAPVVYRGRALDQAHAKHPIMGGHFARRRQILKETLEAYAVPDAVKQAWLEHTDSLRPLITSQSGSDCDPVRARQNLQSSGSKR
jgi:hemoglobin